MKKFFAIPVLCGFSILFVSCGNSTHAKIVKLGTQSWASDNLNVTTFRNGDVIQEARTNEAWANAGREGKPAWCYFGNDKRNNKKYGKLYNWFAVNDPRGLAPEGWHVPGDAEWAVLIDFLGGEDVAGSKLKNTEGWIDVGGGSNTSGFSGLPCGYRSPDGAFGFFLTDGYFWSSTEDGDGKAWYRNLYYFNNSITRNSDPKAAGFSVRCIKN
jgi:uncharacterized protein (TIGR02145 family)